MNRSFLVAWAAAIVAAGMLFAPNAHAQDAGDAATDAPSDDAAAEPDAAPAPLSAPALVADAGPVVPPPVLVAPVAPVAPARPAPPAHAEPVEGEATVLASEPMSAASSQTVRDRDLQLRPRNRPADIFEVAPGLIVVQHAGGGKANQYFLRGFDADHGTDIAFSLDNVPMNMVTHGHGQGYTDPHFVIPELIDRVEVREGPYFAQDGDFATAGAINLHLRDTIEHSFITYEQTFVANPLLGAGMFNNERMLGAAQTNLGPIRGYLAAEIAHADGPFLHPLNFNHYNVVGRWGVRLFPGVDAALTVMSYSGAWNASGQIPARLIGTTFTPQFPDPVLGNGPRMFTQFDSVDPSEGGQSSRHQAYVTLRARPDANSEFNFLAYAIAYQLAIFSDFTFFADDPVNGDQIEQDDQRTVSGFRATYRRLATVGPVRFLTTVGATLRYDDITNGLHHVYQRQRLEDLVVDHVSETGIGVFAEEQIIPARWFRAIAGLRGDNIDFAVNDLRTGLSAPDPGRNGTRQQALISPKLTLVFSPVHAANVTWDLYANFGRGFHSNDGRGTVIPNSPSLMSACSNPMTVPVGVQCPVTPMTPATGYEIGTRVNVLRRFDFSAAGWLLDLDQETVWDGDTGSTEVGGPTRRLGLTLEARAQLLPWLWADVDASFVNALYTQNAGNANAVALAPPFVLAAGIAARHPIGLFGSVRLRAIGDRPADPMRTLTAQGFAIVSLAAGYRHAWYEIGLNIENLLDSTWREAQFEEASRLRTEIAPVTDLKYTAGTPFAATARLTLYFH